MAKVMDGKCQILRKRCAIWRRRQVWLQQQLLLPRHLQPTRSPQALFQQADGQQQMQNLIRTQAVHHLSSLNVLFFYFFVCICKDGAVLRARTCRFMRYDAASAMLRALLFQRCYLNFICLLFDLQFFFSQM